MSETKNPQDFAAFLESLKVNNEGPEEMHGYKFDDLLSVIEGKIWSHKSVNFYFAACYLFERCRRAESNVKPSDLVEQVKAFVRAGMDAAAIANQKALVYRSTGKEEAETRRAVDYKNEFRRLSEPKEQ